MQMELCSFFKVLADETRYRIFYLLLEGDRCVNEIVRELDLSQSLVSHHLYHLRVAGLVKDRREGVKVCYSINHEKVDEFKRELLQDLEKVHAARG